MSSGIEGVKLDITVTVLESKVKQQADLLAKLQENTEKLSLTAMTASNNIVLQDDSCNGASASVKKPLSKELNTM